MERFGKYELVRKIGSGGMAEVYLARQSVAQGLEKQLVIKKIHPAFARSEQFVAMFVDEAKIALGLNHANIVQVFDFGAVGESFFLAMEHVEGADLLRVMRDSYRRGHRMPYGLAAYIVQQVAKGLDYAHRKTDEAGVPLGIVHRDVSPQNILVSRDGAVKIVDFGIARARHVHEEEGVVKGKFGYMAPEQARGERVDRRADIYSAGVVLFELACGRPLYPGKGKGVLDAVKAGAIPRPRDLEPDMPQKLEDVIVRALAYHPGDRFQTARDLQRALGQFQLAHANTGEGPGSSLTGGELIDSGALAKFLAHAILPSRGYRAREAPRTNRMDRRDARAQGQPGIALSHPSLSRPAADRSLDSDEAARAAIIREVKPVFVIEGRITDWEATARRLGAARGDEILRDLARVAADIAFKHHAELARCEPDGITAVIGLPALADDDVSRAIRVALALIDALDGITTDVTPAPRLAVGIERHTASVRRSGVRFAYELSGNRATIAGRLASGAQGGEVVVGGAVYRAARAEWQFAELEPIALSAGGSERARSYRLVGPKDRAQRMREAWAKTSLFGRDLELKALRDAYRAAVVGCDKRHVAILGEDGIGKRSLVAGFLAGIPDGSAVVLHAAARVATMLTPYSIIADLGRDLLDLAEDATPREVSRRIQLAARLLYPDDDQTREAQGLIQLANLILGGETEAALEIDAGERRRRIIQAVLRVEERFFPEKPLILIVDNVHFADAESIDVFTELLSSVHKRPLLGIVTMRPRAQLADKIAAASAEIIHLDELDAEARREMVLQRFAPGDGVEELAREILRRAGGHPLFIRELFDALIDRGVLCAEPPGGEHAGRLRIVKQEKLGVPDTVEALIATRIDRLPPPERHTLFAASVLGREISARAAAALAGENVDAHLASLCRHGFLRETPGGFAFKNDMAMAVAYRLIPPAERRGFHHKAAAVLGEVGYRPGQDDPVIARHLELSGDSLGAAERYLAAARHAAAIGGNADALRQLGRALKLAPRSRPRLLLDIHRLRAEVYHRLAKSPAQLREIHRAHRLAEALGDQQAVAGTLCQLAAFYLEAKKLAQAQTAAEQALALSRGLRDTTAEAEALRITALIALGEGENRDALAFAEKALALCGDDPDRHLARAHILNAKGGCLWRMGRLTEAIETYAEALVIFRMLGLPRQEAKALNNMGVVFANLGELEDALAHYKSSLKIDQDLGDRRSFALKLANIGQTYADLGDIERAERYLEKALQIAERTADGGSGIDAKVSLGQARLAANRVADAIDQLGLALADAEALGDRYQQIRALAYLALAHLDAGKPRKALEYARKTTALSQKMPMPVGEIYGTAAEGAALAALGRAGEGVERTTRAVRLMEDCPHPTGREHILFLHAHACYEAEKLAAAREAIAAARGEIEKKRARFRDPALAATYQRARIPTAIADLAARLEPADQKTS